MTPLLKIMKLKTYYFIFIVVGFSKLGLIIHTFNVRTPRTPSLIAILSLSTLILSVISSTLAAFNSLYMLITSKFGSTSPLRCQSNRLLKLNVPRAELPIWPMPPKIFPNLIIRSFVLAKNLGVVLDSFFFTPRF